MKKNYIIKSVLTLLFTVFIFLQTNAQIRIVQVDPLTDEVTIHNYGGSTVDINSYQFCSNLDYDFLSASTILSGDRMLVSGEDVTLTSSVSLNNTASDLGLYISAPFTVAANMLDYLQWGTSGHDREDVADEAEIWDEGTTITVDAPYEYTGNGSSDTGVSFWQTVVLGVEDFENKIVFNISPNPVTSILNIQLSKNIIDGNIKVFDILGKQILTKELNPNNLTRINVSDLSKGMYLVMVTSGENTQTKRFIKE